MKKLLTILGSLAIISSGASVIVSYNKTNASSSEIKKVEEEIIKPTDPNNFTINKSKSTWQDIFRDSITGADIFSYSSKNKKDDKKDAEAKFIKALRDLTPNTDKEQAEWASRKHDQAIKDFIRDLRDLTPNTDAENKAWSDKKAEDKIKKEESNKRDAEAKFIKDLKDLTPNTDVENKEWAEPSAVKKEIDELIKKEEIEDEIAKFFDDLAGLTPNTDKEQAEWTSRKHKEFVKKVTDKFISDLRDLTPNTDAENKEWAEPSAVKNEIDKLVEKDEAEDFSKEFNEEINRLDDALKAEFKKWVDEINKIKKEVDAQIDREETEDAINDFINDLEGLIPNTNKNEPDLDEWLKQNKKQNDQIKELLEKEKNQEVLNKYIRKIIHRTKESRKYLTFEGKWVSDLLTSKLKRILIQLNK
ncbi:lipoprotein [Mycoplasma mycoides]|uniref:lipoprotein n=1 Tax=Mycoplasma mycoides TaxID=2102 RepID=UPI00223EE18A|nr:lipoprotein [Mycoplasma mycoides]QVK06080.1 lipoprotein [Mycoplasma mycoides subsp. capri]